MKQLIGIAVLLLFLAVVAGAEDSDPAKQGQAQAQVHGRFYIFVGPMFCTDSASQLSPTQYGNGINTGFGGEALLYKGVAISAEAAYAQSGPYADYGVGVASLDFGYHYISRKQPKLEPFALAGPSFYVGTGGSRGGFNFGGGLNWWFVKHMALRLEIREHGVTNRSPFLNPSLNFTAFTAFRFGVSIR